MEGAGGSSMPSAWRFGVDAASVDIEPCESESWTITQDTMLAFQRLAQSACHGLAQCRQKCRVAKVQGALGGLSDVVSWIKARQQSVIPVDTLSEACHALFEAQQHPEEVGGPSSAASAPDFHAQSPPPPHKRGSESHRGWGSVDSMYTDPDFRSSCLALTDFFRARTRETRLAYVCGYRNALSDVLTWAAAQSTDRIATVRTRSILSMCKEQIINLCTRKRSKLAPVTEDLMDADRASQSVGQAQEAQFPSPMQPVHAPYASAASVDDHHDASMHISSHASLLAADLVPSTLASSMPDDGTLNPFEQGQKMFAQQWSVVSRKREIPMEFEEPLREIKRGRRVD